MVQSPEALEIKHDPLPLVLQCSVTCGVGIMHRSVQCLTNDDQLSNLCLVDLKPEERRTCHNVHDCESAALHLPLLFLCLEHLFLSSSWRCAVFPSVGSHPAKHWGAPGMPLRNEHIFLLLEVPCKRNVLYHHSVMTCSSGFFQVNYRGAAMMLKLSKVSLKMVNISLKSKGRR